MTNLTNDLTKPKHNFRWTICILLFFATTINYLDRQVLSLLKPHLEELFHWDNSDYANIAAVFQITYAISQLLSGRIIDKLDTKWGYAIAIVLWSLGAIVHAWAIPLGEMAKHLLGWTGLTIFSASVLGFMVARIILAIGEAGNFPAAIKATAEYFPKKERALATGIFNSGANIGAILAPLTVPFIAQKWGWEKAFLIIGGIGLLWLFFWLAIYEKPEKQKKLSKEEFAYIESDQPVVTIETTAPKKKVSWMQLLSFRQTWAFAIGKGMTDGVWWFFLFWLPAYLKDYYGMNTSQMILPLSLLYSLTMIGSIGGGWFPMYFIKKGMDAYQGRMKAMFIIALFPLVVLLAQPLGVHSYWFPILLIGIGASAHQAWSANIFSTVSDMFPKHAVGSIVGIGGLAGGLGSVIITKVGGMLFDKYKALGHIETGYSIMFVYCSIAYLIAWFIMKSLVPKLKIIEL